MSGDWIKLTRQELYEKVWEQPMTKLAPTYALSDVGLAKVCRKHNIPRPPVGYWAKLAHGKTVERPELPDLDDEALAEITLFRENFDKEGEVKPTPSRPKIVVNVSERLTSPHPHVKATKLKFQSGKPDSNGIVSSGGGCMKIRVSKKCMPRSLRILNAIVKAWESEGGTVELASSRFCKDEDSVIVALSEVVSRTEVKPPKYEWRKEWRYELTGKLKLEIDGSSYGLRKVWKDGKVQVVESVLGNFISELHDWMAYLKEGRLDRELTIRQQEKAATQRAKLHEMKELEQARHTELMSFVESWERAGRIKKYLKAVRAKIEAKEAASSDPEAFERWLEWADWYADSVCPITKAGVREESFSPPQVTPIQDIEWTSRTRELLLKTSLQTSDDLFALTKKDLCELCGVTWFSNWPEINLVLEGHGYDINDRPRY